jgi:predicted nuclease of restriction endonuclease-like RecB superfamily
MALCISGRKLPLRQAGNSQSACRWYKGLFDLRRTMAEIKAIDTIYKGYKFRSRLEARWAVFFDEIKTVWNYEKDGYSNGKLCYLPDFVIENEGMEIFIEIKPDIPTKEEIKKAGMVATGLDVPVVIMVGDPYSNYIESNEQSFVIEGNGEIISLDKTGLLVFVSAIKRSLYAKILKEQSSKNPSDENMATLFFLCLPAIISCQMAAKKSRKTRFEFGDTLK